MPKRFTDSDKWNDPWFRRLRPMAKLMYLYMLDACSLAGIWEVDLEKASFDTKIAEKDLDSIMLELSGKFEADETHLWLVNFLRRQGNLPLNEANNAHNPIFRELRERSYLSKEIEKILAPNQPLKEGLVEPPCISIGKGKGRSKSKGLSIQEKKRARVKENTDLMNRIGLWFGRRASTLWTVYEAEALDQVTAGADEVDKVEAYYKADIPEHDCRRHDIGTLLNNWSGEVDRATRHRDKASEQDTGYTFKADKPGYVPEPEPEPAF